MNGVVERMGGSRIIHDCKCLLHIEQEVVRALIEGKCPANSDSGEAADLCCTTVGTANLCVQT